MRPEPRSTRATAVLAGWAGDETTARRLLLHDDAPTRAAALGALERLQALTAQDLLEAYRDRSPEVRRRAVRISAAWEDPSTIPTSLLDDADTTVAEEAAFVLGERVDAGDAEVTALCEMARHHDDALCREAAVASLGAIGHQTGLDAVLAATTDIPAVRRRAALALAPFSGEAVEDALDRLASDNDWQVRQAVEDVRSAEQPAPPDVTGETR